MKAQKKEACCKQLLKLFEDELAELPRREASQLIDKFLEGNASPLRERLVYHDRTEIAKQLKKVYSGHTLNTLDRALNHSLSAINEIIDCETEKALKEHEKQLRVQLSGREKLEQSFTDLGFGDDTEEVNLEGTCAWVPASFRHDVDGGHSRTVYGGVSILGRIKDCASQKDKEALLRQIREIAGRVITVDKIINKDLVRALFKQTSEKGKQIVANNIRGSALNKACEILYGELLSSDPRFKVKPNHRVKTPSGWRILDLVVLEKDKDGNYKLGGDKKPKPVLGVEIKAANSPYVRPDSWKAELLGRKPTKQGNQDNWIEKERKDKDGGRFPIKEVRVEKLTKDNCKVQ